MTTLTKKQTNELRTILSNLQRGVNYLKSDRVVGIAQATTNPNGASYTIVNPACIEECRMAEHIDVVNRFIGSNIAGIYTALTQLEQFLTPKPITTLNEEI